MSESDRDDDMLFAGNKEGSNVSQSSPRRKENQGYEGERGETHELSRDLQ